MKSNIKGLVMTKKRRNAFSLLELTFVIVVIGILAAVAIPKLAVTRGDAEIAKAKNTVAAVRNGLATARQKQILEGNAAIRITSLSSTTAGIGGNDIFDGINGDTSNPVLTYPLLTCENANSQACWYMPDANTYRYVMPVGDNVDFNISNNSKFDCKQPTSDNCKLLTR